MRCPAWVVWDCSFPNGFCRPGGGESTVVIVAPMMDVAWPLPKDRMKNLEGGNKIVFFKKTATIFLADFQVFCVFVKDWSVAGCFEW